MSQIEASKVVKYVLVGANGDEATASKVVMYLLLEPGEMEDDGDTSRQGHVHAQILRRS